MQRIRKDDLVQVIAGRDRGRSGRVMKVFPREGKCIVEGVGITKRHQKATPTGGPAGIIEKNMRIDLSNVMPLDDKTKKPVRVKVREEGGKRIRQAAGSGNTLSTTAKL